MNWLSQRSIDDNNASDGNWKSFATHRARLTELLRISQDGPCRRLCLLGAGNCNDSDLPALLKIYKEIHLVDLDKSALIRGVARQGLGDSLAVQLHGGIDITGALDVMASWSPKMPISDKDLVQCMKGPVAVLPRLPGPFDVVASTCLVSQLLRNVVTSAGEAHPQFLQAIQAVRAGHLRFLVELVAGGGCGLLITDLVSSDSYPPLSTIPTNQLPGVIARLIQESNFFHGLNPAILATFFQSDPVVGSEIAKVDLIQPWLWDLGPRTYAVYALRFFRKE